MRSSWFRFIPVAMCFILASLSSRSAVGQAAGSPLQRAEPVAIRDVEALAHRQCPALEMRIPKITFVDTSYNVVDFEVTVEADGSVSSVVTPAMTAPFESAAKGSALACHYAPFERDGVPVRAVVTEHARILPLLREPLKHVPFPDVENLKDVSISLKRERDAYGQGRSYEVVIRGDGTAIYNGVGGVVAFGNHPVRVTRAEFAGLLDQFRVADFFSLEKSYLAPLGEVFVLPITSSSYTPVTPSAQDEIERSGTSTLTVRIGQLSKVVKEHAGEAMGMPRVVTELEREVDHIADTKQWILGSAQTVPQLKKEGWNFKSAASAKMLAAAANGGSLDLVRDLLAEGVLLSGEDCGRPEPCDRGAGSTALEAAALRGDLAMVELLLSFGAGKGHQGSLDYALDGAVSRGNRDLMQVLLRAGANPDASVDDSFPKGRTILMTAAETGAPQVVQDILDLHPKLDARDQNGSMALHAAAGGEMTRCVNCRLPGSDRPAVIRLLVSTGADPNAADNGGNTPLHNTADGEVAQALVDAGADVNARNEDGETPLIATYSGAVAAVLVAAGADLKARDNAGKTALQRALAAQNADKIAVIRAALTARARAVQ